MKILFNIAIIFFCHTHLGSFSKPQKYIIRFGRPTSLIIQNLAPNDAEKCYFVPTSCRILSTFIVFPIQNQPIWPPIRPPDIYFLPQPEIFSTCQNINYCTFWLPKKCENQTKWCQKKLLLGTTPTKQESIWIRSWEPIRRSFSEL